MIINHIYVKKGQTSVNRIFPCLNSIQETTHLSKQLTLSQTRDSTLKVSGGVRVVVVVSLFVHASLSI